METVTRRSTRRYGDYTPEPVQRTLQLRSGDLDDDDEEEEYSDFEELDDYRGTLYRSTTYRPPQVDEQGVNDPESVQEEEEEDVDEHETLGPEVPRSELKRRAAGAAAYFKRPQDAGGVWQKFISSKVVKATLKFLRKLWRFVLRNSFMAVNVLWLLAPLCCFVIAITVPQYLTTAIQYVDVLSSKVIGARGGADAGLEKGAMRTVVQEIVDMKLVGMNEEIGLLRQTVQTQEREIEALKLLHDTLRHAHDEAHQKFSLAEPGSAITIHIEKIVTKHTEELQDVHAAAKQQSMLSHVVKEQEEKMDSVENIVKKKAEAANAIARERDIRKEFIAWRESFERDLQFEMKNKVQDIEDRMSKVLHEEKRALSSSADALRGLDATDPGILRVIEVAVQAVEIKKTGRVDHAALANGASVIYSERYAMSECKSSP
ncbi:unnamed protein product [Phytophthora fragariaefolia]|uniref:Unnamed protein product n=1 Tax=Phytophthora fragariaefolia TaxID=1490495 RepID=A0A9W6XT65_9STRA|nr:unnamed protein product [Phytophthora fragariaefolia]